MSKKPQLLERQQTTSVVFLVRDDASNDDDDDQGGDGEREKDLDPEPARLPCSYGTRSCKFIKWKTHEFA